jgi:hypothetical protein
MKSVGLDFINTPCYGSDKTKLVRKELLPAFGVLNQALRASPALGIACCCESEETFYALSGGRINTAAQRLSLIVNFNQHI